MRPKPRVGEPQGEEWKTISISRKYLLLTWFNVIMLSDFLQDFVRPDTCRIVKTKLFCKFVRFIKARQMSHYGVISLWCASLLTDTRFYSKMNNCKAHLILHQEQEHLNDLGRPSSCNNFTDKKAKWLLLEAVVVVAVAVSRFRVRKYHRGGTRWKIF